ncbi:MAG: HRDC domain-containing protein [Phycisphaeraceae bacterium]
MRVYRSRHRHNHDAAAHEQEHEPAPILDHGLVPQGEPELIMDAGGLDRVLKVLKGVGRFGYDTEFIGETTFFPRICLIQLGTADGLYLIDALAGLDLTGFWELLADPGVMKLVHAGRQDLEPVLRLLGRPARSVYDVQVAAGFAGFGYPLSLGKLVMAATGADLGHSVKFSQWDRRPLTSAQLHYAANDVRYLPLVYDALCARIDDLGHTEKVAEEMAALEEPDRYRLDPLGGRLRGAGAGKLNRRERVILDALLVERFAIAQEEDLPPRSVMGDDVLVRVAGGQPETVDAVAKIKGLPRPIATVYGDRLLAAIERGQESPIPARPGRPKINPDKHKKRVEAVWERMEERCAAMSIDPAVVISKRDLATLVLPVRDRLVRDVAEPNGWRAALLDGCWPEDRNPIVPMDGAES